MKKIKLNPVAVLSFYARSGVPNEVLEELAPVINHEAMTSTLLKETNRMFVVGIEIDGMPTSVITFPNEAKALVIEKENVELEQAVARQKKLLAELAEVNELIAQLSSAKFH